MATRQFNCAATAIGSVKKICLSVIVAGCHLRLKDRFCQSPDWFCRPVYHFVLLLQPQGLCQQDDHPLYFVWLPKYLRF
jgi:hypothetical protein